jgi:hypothetical protein
MWARRSSLIPLTAVGGSAFASALLAHSSVAAEAPPKAAPLDGRKYRVGVLGATGTVGQQFLKYLDTVRRCGCCCS